MKTSTLAMVSLSALSLITTYALAGDKPLERSQTEEVTASVESVDPATRELVLKGSKGTRLAMVASPEVRNFEQIKPGDKVVASYQQALAAEVKPRGTPISPPATRPSPGARTGPPDRADVTGPT